MSEGTPHPEHLRPLYLARTLLQQVKRERDGSGNFAQEINWKTGDPTEAIEALSALIDAPAVTRYCECPGFQDLVKLGVIRHASHQVLNSATGKLRTLQYYAIGPNDPARSAIIAYCPACAGRVRVNEEFVASVQVETTPQTAAPAEPQRQPESRPPFSSPTPNVVPPTRTGPKVK